MREKLQAYAERVTVGDEMLWKGAWGSQLVFLRDELHSIFSYGLGYNDRGHVAVVIGEHRSKSIMLPVVEFHRPDLGLRVIVRGNFHDWKMTVLSDKPLEIDFSGLCYTSPPPDPEYTGNPLAPCYFEGFPSELVRGYYDENHSEFSLAITRSASIVAFLVMRAAGGIMPLVWSVRAPKEKS